MTWAPVNPDDWKAGKQSWWEIVFEGEWQVTAARVQQEIGPEYAMYLDEASKPVETHCICIGLWRDPLCEDHE